MRIMDLAGANQARPERGGSVNEVDGGSRRLAVAILVYRSASTTSGDDVPTGR